MTENNQAAAPEALFDKTEDGPVARERGLSVKSSALTPRPALAIFDLDGTLVDTRDGIIETFQRALAEAGYPAPAAASVAPLIGLPLDPMFRLFLPALPTVELDELVARLIAGYRAIYHETVTPRTRPFAGVPELLAGMRAVGVDLVVATSKLERIARDALAAAGLAEFFGGKCACRQSLVLGNDSVPAPKPAPDMVLRALVETGTRANQAVVIGDTDHDIEMGRRAGVRIVAVTYGVQSRERLAAAQPDWLLDSPGEIASLFGLD